MQLLFLGLLQKSPPPALPGQESKFDFYENRSRFAILFLPEKIQENEKQEHRPDGTPGELWE